MSKNTNLSFLTDYITADIANGRIGINNASPTVAFDVVGATKITGVLTLSSTISNGTFAYTLPSATGTLALTSALSGTTNYIPKFTSSTAIGNSVIQDNGTSVGINGLPTSFSTYVYLDIIGNATTQGGLLQSRNSDNSIIGSFFVNANGLNLRAETSHSLILSTAATERMRINASGLTTFTNSVSAASGFIGLNGYGTTSYVASTATGAYCTFSSSIYAGIDGIYQSSGNTNDFAIWTNGGTASQAKFVIKNGGNVGIGNTGNSSRKLEVTQPTGYSAGIRIIAETGPGDAKIQFFGGGSSQMDIGPTSASPNDLIFGAGGSERMRITSGGYLLVGQTADNPIISHTAGARIAAESIFSNSASECLSIQRMNNTGVMAVFYYWSGIGGYTNVGNISTNGSTITFSGTALSDARYKENITPITNALDSINQVDWVEFKFKENQKNSAGITAQQLKNVDALSKFVIDGSDEESYKTVDYNAIIGYLGKAIQELSAEITILKFK